MTKKPPIKNGWCWVTYDGKNGKVECPAQVTTLDIGQLVHSARSDIFHRMGDVYVCNGKKCPELRFGDIIPPMKK